MHIRGMKRMLMAGAVFAPLVLTSLLGTANAASENADYYIRSAQRLLKNNDIRGAEIQLRNAVQRAPDDGAIRLQLAEIYLQEDNSLAAEAELIVAKKLAVDLNQLDVLMAQAMFRNGELGELLRDLSPGNRAPASESVVRAFRGLCELSVGEEDSAETMLEDAERLDPQSTLAKIAMARLLLVRHRTDDAERKADEALALEPTNSQGLDVKGIAFLLHGDPDQALKRFDEALKADPGNLQALLDRANVNVDRGNYDAAEKDLRIVRKAIKNSLMVAYLEALIDARQGNFDDADDELNNVRALMDRNPDTYFLAGVVKYNLDQREQAESYLTRYIAKRNDRPDAYILLGALAIGQGNPDRAIAMLDQAIKLAPGNADAIGLLGQAYTAKGETSKALALLDQAVKAEPGNVSLRTQLALSHFTSGETGTALAELNDVFKSGTGNALAGPSLVLGALRSARTEQAAAAAENLIKLDPKNLYYQQLLAAVRVAQNDLPAAEKLFSDILRNRPDEPIVRQNLAQVYLLMNRGAEAKKVFQDKIARDTSDAESLRALAALYAGDGDYDTATSLLGRARLAAPGDPAPRLQLAALYETQKKWPDAIREERALVAQFSGNIEARDALGRSYVASGDVGSGVATYRDAVRAFPTSSLLQANYAAALAAAKDFDGAIEAMRQATVLEPRSDVLKRALVDLTYQARGSSSALEAARNLAKTNPDDPIGDILTADLLERDGKRGEAIALLEKVQAKSAASTVLLKLVDYYQRNKDTARAVAALEVWTKKHPSDLEPRFRLGRIYIARRNFKGALEQYESLANDRPDDATVLNNLAWAYQSLADPRARATAEKAYRLAPDSASVADTLGWVLASENDAGSALKYLEAAMTAMPQDPDVQYHYALALSKTKRSADAQAVLQKLLVSNGDFDSKAEAQQLLNRIGTSTR